MIVLQPWQQQVQDTAMRFAQEMERQFLLHVNKASSALPSQSSENRSELILQFIDALITTTCGISGQYINKSGEFEEAVVQAVRDKFTMLRKMEIEGRLDVVK